MGSGQNITSGDIRRRLEQAGDDYPKLFYIIVDCKLVEDDSKLPRTAKEAKQLIQGVLDAEDKTMKERFNDLERTIKLLIPTLAKGRPLETKTDDLYRKTITALQSHDVSQFLICLLDVHILDYNDNLHKRSAALEQAEVKIMIIGETCAGKSSVMNVLMAGKYLPVDHGECTRVTCELKARKYRRAAIHYNEKFNLDPTELQLTTDAETADWRRVRNCINWGYDPGKNQEGDEKKYVEKVIIYWPILHMKDGSNNDDEARSVNTEDQELQDGSNNDDETRTANTEDQELQECPMIKATFVDSPGFGANQETYSYLKVRAESCDAYIFVINNASHHGIEADRVQKMMDLLHEHAKSNDTILNPSGTLFICTKWDLVPSGRKENFQREIMKQLQDIWPGIMEEQLFPFSATQALNEIIAENPSELYCDFMRHICNFVENAVQLKLENHCLWLLRFLERASALVKNCKKLDYAKLQREKLLKHAQYFKSILSTLNERCADTVRQIEKTGMDMLKSSIKSCMETNAKQLCKWLNEDIPSRKQDEDWDSYRLGLEREIANRIQTQIVKDSHVVRIIHDWQENLNQINEELSKKNHTLSMFGPAADDESAVGFVSRIVKVLYSELFRIISYLRLGLKRTTNIVNDKEETFSEDPLQYMTLMTAEHVKSITESKLSSVALDLLKNVQDIATEIKTNIRKRVKTIDTFCYAVSSAQFNSFTNTLFQTLTSECRNFYFLEIMKHEIDHNSLMIDKNNKHVIGTGKYGKIYKGSLQKGSTHIQIAAKIVASKVSSEYSSVFRECFLMRQLMLSAKTAGGEFPPVVFYFGSSYSKSNDMHEVIIVMELCDTDLGRQVEDGYLIPPNNGDSIRFPGEEEERPPRNRAAREPTLCNISLSYALQIALQAAKGLSFIHKNGIVHRDVKPSNCLMCVRGTDVSVKITDFGASIEQDIIATCEQKVGTLHYDAPEIRLDPITNHSFASDVYSFGLVLWEVWYGEQVFSEILTNQPQQMMQPPTFRAVYPPEPLQLLMQACWKNTPTDRPNMTKVVEELTEIIAQNPRILS